MTQKAGLLESLETQERRELGYFRYALSVTADVRKHYDDYEIPYESLCPKEPKQKGVVWEPHYYDTYDVDSPSVNALQAKLYKGMFEADYYTVVYILKELALTRAVPTLEIEEMLLNGYEEIRKLARVFLNNARTQTELNRLELSLANVDEMMNEIFPKMTFSLLDSTQLHTQYKIAGERIARAQYVANIKEVVNARKVCAFADQAV